MVPDRGRLVHDTVWIDGRTRALAELVWGWMEITTAGDAGYYQVGRRGDIGNCASGLLGGLGWEGIRRLVEEQQNLRDMMSLKSVTAWLPKGSLRSTVDVGLSRSLLA